MKSDHDRRGFRMSIIQGLGFRIEGRGTTDILPKPAGDKLRWIIQLRDDARATLRPITEQIRELQVERQGHLLRVKKLTDPRGIGGDSLPENNTSVKDAQRRADKIAEELARLREVDEVRSHRYGETSTLVRNIEDYVRSGCPSGTIFEMHKGEPPQLKKGENVTDAIEARRRQLRKIAADVHQIESRPLPSSVAKARMRDQVERWSLAGAPSVESTVWFGTDLTFPTETLRSDVRMQSEFGLAFAEVHNPIAFAAWLNKDELINRLDAEITAAADDKHALSADERAKQLAALASDALTIQREEEMLVQTKEQVGHQMMRRPDADPRAVLGVELISTASRSSSTIELVSKLLIGK